MYSTCWLSGSRLWHPIRNLALYKNLHCTPISACCRIPLTCLFLPSWLILINRSLLCSSSARRRILTISFDRKSIWAPIGSSFYQLPPVTTAPPLWLPAPIRIHLFPSGKKSGGSVLHIHRHRGFLSRHRDYRHALNMEAWHPGPVRLWIVNHDVCSSWNSLSDPCHASAGHSTIGILPHKICLRG